MDITRTRRRRLLTLAVVGSLLSTAAAADAGARCPMLPDPMGDSGVVGNLLTETVPDDPALDIRSLDMTSRERRLGIVLRVQELTRDVDRSYEVAFDAGGTRFLVYAYLPRELPDAEPRFTVGYVDPEDPVDRYTQIGEIRGGVDRSAARIAVVVDTRLLASRTRVQPGVRLTEVEAASYRAVAGGEVILSSDSTDTTAMYVMGTRGCVAMPALR